MKDITVLLLAAGFGTRLKKLTATTPKPLVSLGKCKLIDCAVWQMKKAGICDITVNLHYLGEQIEEYLGDGSRFDLSIRYSKEDPILGTGGAVKKVLQERPGKDILVFNTDAVFGKELNLTHFIDNFLNSSNISSMILTTPAKEGFGGIHINKQRNIKKVLNFPSRCDEPLQEANFCGVQIFSPRVGEYMKDLGDVFCSIRDLYPKLLESDESISAYIYKGYFQDTGTEERLQEVIEKITEGAIPTPESRDS